jgi:hypothetical protein
MFVKNIKLETYLWKIDLQITTKFVKPMKLWTFWEWVWEHEEMWHVLWLGEPFMDQTLVGKILICNTFLQSFINCQTKFSPIHLLEQVFLCLQRKFLFPWFPLRNWLFSWGDCLSPQIPYKDIINPSIFRRRFCCLLTFTKEIFLFPKDGDTTM